MARRQVFLNSIFRNCKGCGQQFEISPAQQQKMASLNFDLPRYCPDCRDKKKTGAYKNCVDCGEQFFISDLEKVKYEKNGLKERNRCWKCIEKNKEVVNGG
jgi:hypothetical protein